MKKWIVFGIIVLFVGYLSFKAIFPIDIFEVSGHNMEPTLKQGDKVVLSKYDKNY